MKKRIAILFGGRSVEHEVSVITALQAYNALNKENYQIIPIYIHKNGEFYTNNLFLNIKNYKNIDELVLQSKRIFLGRKKNECGFFEIGLFSKFTPFDMAFPIFHGSFGEDGCIQGLFEMYQIPYVGFDVLGSAVAMDKVISKQLFVALDLPIGKYTFIDRKDWFSDSKNSLIYIKRSISYPAIVKPATLGSSIGVSRVIDDDTLQFAIEVASEYSEKIVIEEEYKEAIEINCSVLGYKDEVYRSVCEMPVKSSKLLSFSDKYQKGDKGGKKHQGMASSSRVIPAPISEALSNEIQDASGKIFQALNGCGVARIDFFIDRDKKKFWVNEINSPPGSLAFYLWEHSGINFSELIEKLIKYGERRAYDKSKTHYTFESGLLSQMAISHEKKP